MEILTFIDETLQIAGEELMSRFGRDNNVRSKKDTSLVTDADLASERIILDRISKYFPQDAVISEESGYHRVSREPGQHVWIVDPLDGTTNFANGYPLFSISIARCVFNLVGEIEAVAGGIGDPIRGKHYLASLGGGAHCNGSLIWVQSPRPVNQCFLVTGFYYTMGDDLDREIERFRHVAQLCQSIRRDGSAALDLALVAAGVFDAFWERGLALWDVAAGSLLVTEAGGQVRNYARANSASLAQDSSKVLYRIEADGIIAGAPLVVGEIQAIMNR